MIDRDRLPDERGSTVKTVDVDHCAEPGRGVAHGADIDAATAANQELGSA